MTTAQQERLTRQHERMLLSVLEAYRDGSVSARLPDHWTGLHGRVAEALNQILDRANDTRSELERLARFDRDEGRASNCELDAAPSTGAVAPGLPQPAIRPPSWWLEWRVRHVCRELHRRAVAELRPATPADQGAAMPAASGLTVG